MKKKAQLVVFIIIGLAFLVAVGLTIYIVSITAKERGEKAVREQQLAAELAAPVDEFVTRCLKLTAEDGLLKLGQQGGALEPSQAESVSFGNTRVAFGIIPPTRNIAPFFYRAPDSRYPWPSFPADNPPFSASMGYFGLPSLPTLEKIKSELETFVNENVKECTANWADFAQQGIQISAGEPLALANFARENTQIQLNWTIEISSGQRKTAIEKFATGISVKFRTIYETAVEIAKKDSTNIYFNPKSEGAIVSKRVDGVNDIITIKDASSLIANKPFEFSFGRKNRAPALHNVTKDISIPICAQAGGSVELNYANNRLNITGKIIQLNATDPDEDTAEFRVVSGIGLEITKSNNKFQLPGAYQSARQMTIYAKEIEGQEEDWQTINIQVGGCG